MEPLFLDSPMHEKIWGGNRLKTEFGYDIPSEHTGEYWAISAHPNGVSYVKWKICWFPPGRALQG